MPFPVQIGRLARELQRRLGIQGFLALTLLEDVQPVIPMLTGPEGAFQREEALRWSYMVQVASIGLYSRITLYNPAGSGRLCVVEGGVFGAAAGASALYIEEAAGPVGGLSAKSRDTRLATDGGVPCGCATDTPAGASGDLIWSISSRDILPVNLAVVLSPGWCLRAMGLTVNTTMSGTVYWRDFRHAPQELT